MNKLLLTFYLFVFLPSNSQVNGGKHVFSSLNIDASPRISALGGMVVSNPANDVSLVFANPALMDTTWQNRFSVNYYNYFAQTQFFTSNYIKYFSKIKTILSGGICFNNFGNIKETDVNGTVLGDFYASDYVLNLSASRYYLSKWKYGSTLKIAGANYGTKTALATALDVGVVYSDTSKHINAGLVFKNIGFPIKKFVPDNSEILPFDIQIGITKRLEHVPFRFSILAHSFYTWDIRYNNPADIVQSSFNLNADSSKRKSYFADKFFRHFIFSGEIFLGKNISFISSYNHLRRSELSLSSLKGTSGFSFGLNLDFSKWHFSFGKSVYNQVGGTNHLGLNIIL